MKEDLTTQQEHYAVYEKVAKRAAENLNKRGINARFVPTRKEALSAAMDMIPEGVSVGTADSTTLLQVGVISALRKRGKNEILNPFVRDEKGQLLIDGEERKELMRRVLLTDVYVIGTNAVTLDGKLVNVDGNGNRVAAMIFGPKKVIIVAGANKVVKDLDAAIKRVREYCAPRNVIRHGTKHHRTQFMDLPCAKTGLCIDCNHPYRICQYTTIIEGAIEWNRGRINVILVGEELGL
jgi:L-lactate utilization protein LutB